MKLERFNESQNELDAQIAKIDQEIEALKKKRNELLKIKNSQQTSIIDRINNLCNMNWEVPSSIKNPFGEIYIKDFISKEGLGKHPIIDDYTIFKMDYYDRHEIMSIAAIAESIMDDVDGDLTKEVNILYDRSSKKYYKVVAQDALDALEKWAIENEIHSWEIDW